MADISRIPICLHFPRRIAEFSLLPRIHESFTTTKIFALESAFYTIIQTELNPSHCCFHTPHQDCAICEGSKKMHRKYLYTTFTHEPPLNKKKKMLLLNLSCLPAAYVEFHETLRLERKKILYRVGVNVRAHACIFLLLRLIVERGIVKASACRTIEA